MGPGRQPDKIGESLANRTDLPLLKTWFAPRQPSVGTSSPRPSGYARPPRFAKEFGPDQVLISDSLVSDSKRRRFTSAVALEYNKYAVETIRKNRPDLPIIDRTRTSKSIASAN